MKKIYSFLVVSLFSVMLLSAAPTTGLQFSGVSTSIIALESQAAFSPTQFTLEVWANYTVLNGGGYILSTEGWNPSNHGFSLRLNGNKLNFSIGDGSGWPGINSSADITPNTWFHAAVTCTATEMKMYINGVQDATATLTSPMVASTARIVLGESPTWTGRLFNGKMAELRFWNVAKTQTEIAADMTSTLTGTETGLVVGWKMNEGVGATVADVTGVYNLTKTADVAWFGPVAGVESVGGNTINVESAIYGHTLEVANKTNGKLQLAIFSITGQKVMEDIVKTGTKFQKQLTNISGSYILKCTAEDGSVYAKRFIIR